MSDYISREAMLEKAEYDGNYRLVVPVEAIKGLPTADVEPVRHGEWLRTDDDWSSLVTIQCSACGGEWCFEVDEDVQLLGYKLPGVWMQNGSGG